MTVTLEQLRTFAPDLPASTNLDGHALEVIERVRAWYYEQRTAANAAQKSAQGELERAEAKVVAASVGIPAVAPVLPDAAVRLEAAKACVAKLDAQQAEALRAIERSAGTRARASDLRTKAADAVATLKPVAEGEYEGACRDGDAAGDKVTRLRAELAAAEEERALCNARVSSIESRVAFNDAANERAKNCIEQAEQIEAALAETAVAPVSASDFEIARELVRDATEQHAIAVRVGLLDDAKMIAKAMQQPAADATAEASRLDGIVQALTHEAPGALFSGSAAIRGLSLQGDEVLLDNVRLDGLCGAEQLKFAVEIARRANAKGKVLIVDGLERLDPEQLAVFVSDATAGGWQLLATRVAAGDVVIEAIQPEAPATKSVAEARA
jgi:sulfur relay (sulfurtransferase) complex TusBCD TusD component (DsrE family)